MHLSYKALPYKELLRTARLHLFVHGERLVTSMSIGQQLRRPPTVILVVTLFMAVAPGTSAAVGNAPPPEIENGFRLMYGLNFTQAEREFASFKRQHLDNPMGPVSEAADLLFGELQRLGVLETQFYENDSVFRARKKLVADPAVRQRFNAAVAQTEDLAHARLSKNPHDHDSLFALTLAAGLQADYLALIEKRNLVSLRYAKQASVFGNQLLAVHPDCYDAHLASGVSRYLTGSLAAPLRWLARLRGANPDKQGGIAELQLTAEHGDLLAPFARILLAIAYVRDKDKTRALAELDTLHHQFPSNPLFTTEIARLEEAH